MGCIVLHSGESCTTVKLSLVSYDLYANSHFFFFDPFGFENINWMPKNVNVKVMNDLLSTTGLIFQWCAVSIQWAHTQAVIRESAVSTSCASSLLAGSKQSQNHLCLRASSSDTSTVYTVCPPLNWHCTTASFTATKIEKIFFLYMLLKKIWQCSTGSHTSVFLFLILDQW